MGSGCCSSVVSSWCGSSTFAAPPCRRAAAIHTNDHQQAWWQRRGLVCELERAQAPAVPWAPSGYRPTSQRRVLAMWWRRGLRRCHVAGNGCESGRRLGFCANCSSFSRGVVSRASWTYNERPMAMVKPTFARSLPLPATHTRQLPLRRTAPHPRLAFPLRVGRRVGAVCCSSFS